MKDIANIKKNIEKLGIDRCDYSPFDFGIALKYYKNLADLLLKNKDEKFDYNAVKFAVDYIINWTYLKESNIEFKKGFLIKGKTGRGKSFLFKVWAYFLQIDGIKYKQNGETISLIPHIANVKKISGEYQHPVTGGYQVIERYSKYKCLAIDDIGKEGEYSKNFGNSLNVVEEIVNNREDEELLTFGTTNLDKLSDVYDDRTVSRMNRLFKGIGVNHDIDYRITPNKIKL